MRKSTIFSTLAVAACLAAGSLSGHAQTLMNEGSLDYPAGLYTSFPPGSMSVTWDNQPIELVDPHQDDFGDEYATAYVQLGEGEKLPVNAYVMYSFGDPEDPEDKDIWNLDVALYDIDDLWSFDGDIITVSIPEGIVKNMAGAINPAQDFVFHIVPPFTDYTITPQYGSTLTAGNLTVKVDFGGNPLKYLQSEVSLRTYEPSYREILLQYGKEVTISGNQLQIDLSSVESGEYELVIPEGFLIVTVNGEDHLSPDIWVEYTIDNTAEVDYMEDATLAYPSGLYTSFAPSSVSVTWNDQPIELVNPQEDEYGDQYVTAYAQLGEGEKQPVNAYILYSFGDPENPDDNDIWNLDIALYDIDDLWSFDGSTVTVILPEGIVKNAEGAVNPAQDFVFQIVPTFTDYTVDPESGSTIDAENAIVRISFEGNPLEYLQSEVSLRTYEPTYKEILLQYGKEVTITADNELAINLTSVEDGEYELVIPEGFLIVTVDGEMNISPDIWLEYTISRDSGVDILNGDSHFDVYSLQGIRLLTTDDASAVRRLPAGIYIVNGRKVVIRK